MLLVHLFTTFLLIGFVSFGGGYAMVPLMEREVLGRGWMSAQEFSDAVALGGMSPGPIGTNIAVFIGYHTAGISGAVFSIAGMVIPSLLIIVAAAIFFMKHHSSPAVKTFFYILRPLIVGLIFYGAYRFAANSGMIAPPSSHILFGIVIFVLSLVALLRFRMHPLTVILLSGLIGMAILG